MVECQSGGLVGLEGVSHVNLKLLNIQSEYAGWTLGERDKDDSKDLSLSDWPTAHRIESPQLRASCVL